MRRGHGRRTGPLAKDLILHIGMDKTGTTAIQHYLHTRRRWLEAEDGLLVPVTGMWSDHSHHVIAFAALGMSGHRHSELGGLFSALTREAAESPAPRVVLSSECLFKLPVLSPDSPFWDHVARHFGRISAVVYVRRQDRWVESRYRHLVISGKELSIASLSQPRFSDYKRFIDAWADRLGRDAVTVRPYERGQFLGGDIAQDFRAAIGLGPDEGGQSALRNEAFAWDDVLFRAAANHLGLPEASLHRLNSLLLARPRDGRPNRTMISPAQAAALVARYEPVNAAIAREYLGRADGVLFREPPPAADPDWREPILPAEGFAAILGFVSDHDGRLGQQIAAAARALPGEDAQADPSAALARLHDRLRIQARAAPSGPSRRRDARPGLARLPLRLAKAAAIQESMVGAMGRLRDRLHGGRLPAPPVHPARHPDRPARRRILVHFGARKTGSSSIQETLFAVRDGWPDLACASTGRTADSSLVIRNAFLSEEQLAARIGSGRDPAALRQQARRQLESMCAAARHASRAILSAETISDLDPAQLSELNGLLSSHWPDVAFAGYVREPVSYARSAFQERLKTSLGRGFDLAAESGLTLNHHRVVDRLDALVGREAVQVFPFERDLFPEGDIVRHFLGLAGLDAGTIPIRRVNESLSTTAVKALYSYRRLRVANDVEIGHDASRAAFVAALAGIEGPAFALHPDIEQRIAAANLHILDWSEARLGRRLRLPVPAEDGRGLRDETELMRFDEAEMEELARWAASQGLRAPAAQAGAEGVADLLAELRLRLAARGRVAAG